MNTPHVPKSTRVADQSTRSSKAAINSSLNKDDDHCDDQGHTQLYKHNKPFTLTNTDQPPSVNDLSSHVRKMLINVDQRVDARAGVGVSRPQLPINHNRRPVAHYTDEGLTHHYGKIKHFGHPHHLNKYSFQQYSEISCRVCGLQLVGSGYGCLRCQFCLHPSCFDLPQKIQHDAHTAHPLTLRYPSYYTHLGKACNACNACLQNY